MRPRRRSFPQRRPEAPIRDVLERAALRYLERYESSERNLRQVLKRRARKALDAVEADAVLREQTRRWIDEIVDHALARGLVDDRRYAEGLVRLLRRRGSSHRASWRKLREKGVAEDLIALQLGPAPDADVELAAAVALARRRGLGPWRTPDARAARRDRDLAALARAGFDLDVALRVVDAASPEALPEAGPRAALG